jgi:hypothetical protein
MQTINALQRFLRHPNWFEERRTRAGDTASAQTKRLLLLGNVSRADRHHS